MPQSLPEQYFEYGTDGETLLERKHRKVWDFFTEKVECEIYNIK